MATKKLPLVEASDEQIRDFTEIQGLDASKANTRAKLVTLLASVWDHEYILIQVSADADNSAPSPAQAAPVVPQPGQTIDALGLDDPEIVVRLSNTEGPGGKQPVPIGVNGRTIVVQRNMDVAMPYRFYLALKNAIRQEIEPDEKGVPMDPVDVENYPCSVVRAPSEAEIRAWHERTDSL